MLELCPQAGDLLKLTCGLKNLLANSSIPLLDGVVKQARDVLSPFAGGCHAGDNAASDMCHRLDFLNVACFNPGRTGLAALGTNQILHWRLFAIAAALEEADISICALPGARFPPGCVLPENFPYSWLGVQTL